MIVLDENIRDSQADYLRKLGIANRKIGADLAAKGTSDANIIPLLLRLKQPTFFTHDADFWDVRLCHAGYGVVYLSVKSRDAAGYIRRFLRHTLFNTSARRLGRVAQIHVDGITYYITGSRKAHSASWANR